MNRNHGKLIRGKIAASLLASALLFGLSLPAPGAEGGFGAYLLGSRIPYAGIVPAPGIYFQNDVYFFQGDVSRSITLPIGGQLAAGLKATTWLDLPTIQFSTPLEIFGGNLAISGTFPFGTTSVDAALGLSAPGLPPIAAISSHDSITTIADPFFTSQIGWHAGNWHWTTGMSINVPVGDYRKGALANVSTHHWAADFFAGITWLDPTIGLNLSALAGVTFNAENRDADYKSGNQYYVEWAVTQNLSKQFAIGFVGYFWEQFTGDSGTGAVLGPLRGRVLALGGLASYDFKIDQLPVTARIKLYQDINVKGRLKGSAGYLTFSMPLYVKTAAMPPGGGKP